MVYDENTLVAEYEINPFTMIIFPHEYSNKIYSRIIELEDEFISPFKPTEIVKKGCEHNLSDYNARKKVARRLIRVTHKAPIVIDPSNSVYLLPTKSPSKPDCIWISHEHVLDHRRYDAKSTLVTFRNRKTFVLPLSYSSFDSQFFRASQLKSKISEKMKENERKAQYIIYGRWSSGERIQSMVSEKYQFDK